MTDLDTEDLERLHDLSARHEKACNARPINHTLCELLADEVYRECDRVAAACALAREVDRIIEAAVTS